MAQDISFNIIAHDKATSTFTKISKSTDSTSKHFKGFASVAKKTFAVLAVAEGVKKGIDFLKDSAKAAVADEQANAVLARQLKNTAHATKAQTEETEKWLISTAKATGIARNELTPALTRLVTVTHDTGRAQNLLNLAMNISAGTHKSLTTVTAALTRAQLGSTAGLSRLGVVTKDASGKALKFSDIQKRLAKTFKGDVAAAANTAGGRMRRLGVVWEEMKVSIGAHLLPALSNLVGFLLDRVGPAVGGIADIVKKTFVKLKIPSMAGKVSAAFKGVDISGIGKRLAVQSKAWAAPIIDGFTVGMNTGNWSDLGKAVGKGLVKAVNGAGVVAGKLFDSLSKIFAKVDWVGLGITIGKQAPSLVLGLAAGLLNFDFAGLIKGVMKHWSDVLLGLLAIAFTPGKIIGKVGELLARIPLAGKFLEWALLSTKKLGDGLVSGVWDALKFMGNAFLEGFRKVFPGIGAKFAESLLIFPTRIGLMALRLEEKGFKMLLGLAKGIAKGTKYVVVNLGELVGRILRTFVDSNLWLRQKGLDIVAGLAKGIGSAGSWVVGAIKSIPWRILKVTATWDGLLVDAGKAIIQGLLDGIGKMFGKLKSALGKVTNFIKDHKGPIQKDRKLLTPAGTAIMQGLIAGIEGQRASLRRTLGKVTNSIKVGGRSTYSVAVAGPGGSHSGSAGRAGGGSSHAASSSAPQIIGYLEVVHKTPGGKVIERELIELKNTRGGVRPLGFI